MGIAHQGRTCVRVVGDRGARACLLDRVQDGRGAWLQGGGDGAGVDVRQPVQRLVPAQLPGQVKAVCCRAGRVQGRGGYRRRSASEAVLGQRHSLGVKQAGDLGASRILAQHRGQRDVVAQTGKTDGHVGRASADMLAGGAVGAMNDVDQRLADDQRAHVRLLGLGWAANQDAICGLRACEGSEPGGKPYLAISPAVSEYRRVSSTRAPDTAAARAAASPAPRRGFANLPSMVISMLVIMVAVLAWVAMVPRVRGISQPAVDVTSVAVQVRQETGWAISQPALPVGWKATNVRFDPTAEGVRTWHAGYLSPDGQYVSIDQTQASGATQNWISGRTSHGRAEGTLWAAGRTW